MSAELDDCVSALAWAADGSVLAAASVRGPITLLSLESDVGAELPGHVTGTLSLQWHPAEPLLASAGHDGAVRLWGPGGRNGDAVTEGEGWASVVRWAPRGQHLAAAIGRQLHVVDHETEAVRVSQPQPSTVADLVWHPSRDRIATALYGGVKVWKPDLEEPLELDWKGSALTATWSPDGRFIASGGQDATIHLWIVETGTDLEMCGFERKVLQLAWDSTGRWLATGGGNEIGIWDCRGRGPEGRKPRQLIGHDGPVRALAYAPHRTMLASAGNDGLIALWQPDIRKRPVSALHLDSAVCELAWSPDGRHLAAGDAQGGVHVLVRAH